MSTITTQSQLVADAQFQTFASEHNQFFTRIGTVLTGMTSSQQEAHLNSLSTQISQAQSGGETTAEAWLDNEYGSVGFTSKSQLEQTLFALSSSINGVNGRLGGFPDQRAKNDFLGEGISGLGTTLPGAPPYDPNPVEPASCEGVRKGCYRQSDAIYAGSLISCGIATAGWGLALCLLAAAVILAGNKAKCDADYDHCKETSA